MHVHVWRVMCVCGGDCGGESDCVCICVESDCVCVELGESDCVCVELGERVSVCVWS